MKYNSKNFKQNKKDDLEMKKRVLVLGGGGISLIAASIVNERPDLEMVGYLNDWVDTGEYIGSKKKHKVVGEINEVNKFLEEDENLYVYIAFAGFTNPRKSLEQIHSLNIPEDRFINLIHPMTSIPEDYCEVGHDILAAPFSQVSPEVTLSNHSVLLGHAFVGHNTVIGEFSHIAANAVVGANIKMGKGVHVGTNSVIRERITIGDFSIIGSGAVVLNDVPENAIVVGNPARILKMRD